MHRRNGSQHGGSAPSTIPATLTHTITFVSIHATRTRVEAAEHQRRSMSENSMGLIRSIMAAHDPHRM